MYKRRSRSASAVSFAIETLEGRMVLSGISTAGALHQGTVEVAAQTFKKAATETTLAVSAGTLGQPITFHVTVRAAASAGSPQGTVNIVDHGNVIESLTLSPTTTTSAKSATSDATATLTQQPGGSAYFFGKHAVSAVFVPSGSFSKSTANKSFTVGQPAFTALAGGVKVATIVPGTGAGIQSGQTANVYYTGYLATNGKIFDDSVNDGGTPFSFLVGAGQVIPGFDAGTVGMQVGETRIVRIPPAEAYGSAANGLIPANSTLIFVLTLESIT
jgi:FKBP-type peptidyl-prolyl cis-trans isomerase FkpA